ncbi:tRNA pseudouridine(38-40) synthase TruA [Candidatus Solincola tengchongensis]|uniref:tRNA pseudouridine(38-40) synthase TruA n=1 Tax=Candidatus Solincola tengchongensis TaxID=2900693 RepID=UPI00257B9136|nr:tRNA pseudouridine(38-40) synthase TruA [Candidatus Solincola tengchongensis]
MGNYMLTVAYEGTEYKGFQRQPGLPTVQGELERALERLAVRESPLYAAGRTDAGVHAKGQVVNFHGTLRVDPERLPRSLNALLPPDIAVLECREADEGFHARRSALAREYAYYFHLAPRPSPFLRRFALHVGRELDLEGMEKALSAILGVHDFAPFCRSEKGRSTVREVLEARIFRRGELLQVRVRANAFAWMMMRMLCGALLEVGKGRWSSEDLRGLLDGKGGPRSVPALPPHGLFLEKVYYPFDPPPSRASA